MVRGRKFLRHSQLPFWNTRSFLIVDASSTIAFTWGKPYLYAGRTVVRSQRLYCGPTYNSSETIDDSSIVLLESSIAGSSGLAKVVELEGSWVGFLGQLLKTRVIGGFKKEWGGVGVGIVGGKGGMMEIGAEGVEALSLDERGGRHKEVDFVGE